MSPLYRFVDANIEGARKKQIRRLLNYTNSLCGTCEYPKLFFKQNNLSNRLRNKWI